MSAFSTISALRRRRPEGLPEGNAAAGGGLQGVACRERLAGGGLPGAPCRERLAGGGASQGAPRRGRLTGDVGGPPPRPRDVPASGSPLRPAPARPVRPPGDFPASPPLRAPLRFGLLHRRRSVPSLRPACTSEMPRRLRTPATTQPRNHATTQPPQPLSHAKRALPAWGEPFCIGMASCAYPRNESRIPAATAEPTTPATLGPMACISR